LIRGYGSGGTSPLRITTRPAPCSPTWPRTVAVGCHSGAVVDPSACPGASRRLWVPKTRPCSSSGMCVLVEDAGESVLSPDVEVVESAGVGDRLRSWAQWCCAVQGTVRAVLVVERFELA
jgi:hypothetical protein